MNITINIIFLSVCSIAIILGTGATVAYFFTHPEIVDKWLSIFYKVVSIVYKNIDDRVVKYDTQKVVNSYLAALREEVPNMAATSLKIKWINEDISQDQFIKSGQMVLRMHKSHDQNKNIVNATFAFVSTVILKKAKLYLAKYQKNAINLFVSYDILKTTGDELKETFVETYLNEGLDDEKVNILYAYFYDINKAGLFYPVFVTEMTFLGGKVFARKKERQMVYEEVRNLVNFLRIYSIRRLAEDTQSDFNGQYSNFSIRIVGKHYKIEKQGQSLYLRNLNKMDDNVETIYLIGSSEHKAFIKNMATSFLSSKTQYEIFKEQNYKAVIKDQEGKDFESDSYIMILRNKNVQTYVR